MLVTSMTKSIPSHSSRSLAYLYPNSRSIWSRQLVSLEFEVVSGNSLMENFIRAMRNLGSQVTRR
jgi:hypothetical protein